MVWMMQRKRFFSVPFWHFSSVCRWGTSLLLLTCKQITTTQPSNLCAIIWIDSNLFQNVCFYFALLHFPLFCFPLLFFALLHFHFQPAITSRCLNKDLSKSSMVMATEVTKIIIAIFGVTKEEKQVIKRDWSLKNSLQVAALPAILYAMQNVMVQYAYLLLDGMTKRDFWSFC